MTRPPLTIAERIALIADVFDPRVKKWYGLTDEDMTLAAHILRCEASRRLKADAGRPVRPEPI